MEVDDLGDARTIREILQTNSEGIKTPMFRFPEKWLWFWKIIVVITVVFYVLEIIVLMLKIMQII